MEHEMREMLFRAKRKDNDEWIEGNVLQTDGGDCYIATSCLVGASDEPLMVAAYEVDPKTLCQFIGLADKNGNRIWENDIVQTPFRRLIVTYSDGVWGDRDGTAMRESIFGEGGVVVGNIFDYPELLEGET